MMHEPTNLISIFSALADPTRFAVVSKLLEDGETPAGELHSIADISAPAISRHLKVLKDAGVITQRKAGTNRLYSVNPDAMQELTAWTKDMRNFWEGSLDRLDALLPNIQKD